MSTTTKSTAVTRTRRRAQISRKDVKAIAELVAKRLTIAEACECLGIRARSFYQWKERHANSVEYEALLTRVRGQYLRANLREMEKAAGGKAGVRHDWRAADRLNMIVAERYLPQQQPPEPVRESPVPTTVVSVMVQAVYGGALPAPPAGEVVDTSATKLIADKRAEPEPPPPAPKREDPAE